MNQPDNILPASAPRAESPVWAVQKLALANRPKLPRWRGGNRRRSHQEVLEHFWSLVRKTDSCWIWMGGAVSWGYGIMRIHQVNHRVHIFSYTLHKGPTNGLCVCHRCDNRLCVNPDHLFLATTGENIKDMYSKGRQNPQKGTDRPNCKLTEDKVRAIRERFVARHPINGADAMGREFGVAGAVISQIVHRIRWKHVL